MGDIGEPVRRIDIEPIPASVPEPAPVVPEKEPA